jgi:hypothetical protein
MPSALLYFLIQLPCIYSRASYLSELTLEASQTFIKKNRTLISQRSLSVLLSQASLVQCDQ